ncbi:hypothetical protein GUJ93_ZPchr0458g22355 [Zizania palustris]|uniref:Uncharacterized protein n=1 Tax=Zizania palustris TaxID=103762 RepID=A0A8J5RE92_ZIZPA|nr:hypothetical protein GUJ93_ZPchr0458g22355 [Zizania palustris]
MEWWQREVVVPVKRVWVVVSARLRRKKDDDDFDGRGVLVKLRDDIQTCAYEDVQVMWEILQRAETAKPPGGGARALVWLGRGSGTAPPRRRRC